jgi:hypothetical protein
MSLSRGLLVLADTLGPQAAMTESGACGVQPQVLCSCGPVFATQSRGGNASGADSTGHAVLKYMSRAAT